MKHKNKNIYQNFIERRSIGVAEFLGFFVWQIVGKFCETSDEVRHFRTKRLKTKIKTFTVIASRGDVLKLQSSLCVWYISNLIDLDLNNLSSFTGLVTNI